ncbi:Disease resistance protein [Corchorus capsularis]|uniref:Disease resistance protein n=1 Tax=Corchorus capsularis TaxID=210143 RepID=A0A1R3KX33_COCAP|nr:Disease resistance protein [Corchorus capsularis]
MSLKSFCNILALRVVLSMALEITELLIAKLKVLGGKETQVIGCLQRLQRFKESLKGAEDDKANGQIVDEWKKLLPVIYTLEDYIDSIRSETTLPNPLSFRNPIGKLKSKLKKFNNGFNLDAAQDESVSRSNSEFDEEVEHYMSDNMPQSPTEDESNSAEVTPDRPTKESEASPALRRTNSDDVLLRPRQLPENMLEDKSSPLELLTKTYSEDVPLHRRTNSFDDAQPQLRKRLSRNSSDRQLSEPTEDYTSTDQPNDSEQNISEEKSVTVVFEDLLKMLAKPVVSKRKLRPLMLKADVSSPGKKILLWTVYNSETVKQRFQFRAWINVSELPSELDVVNAILQIAFKGKEEEVNSPERRLHDFLVWRRFLIVLYGVQEGFLSDGLKSAFPHSLNGSRVILAAPGIDGSSSKSLENTHVYLADDSNVRSAKAVIHELTEAILRSRRRLLFLISVVGLVGSDKTSLLWPIYNAQDVKQHFDCRAWVNVVEVLRTDDILAKILEQVSNIKMGTDTRPSREQLQRRLHSFLSKKRFLIVLYGVWTAEIWNKLKACFPNTLNRSRLILAVDSIHVAQRTNSWIFSISPDNLSDDLNDMLVNVSSGKRVKRWVNLADIKDEASEMVGLDDKVEQLAEVALDNSNTTHVIAVLGVEGSGKTTLVRTFYNSRATKQHFDCRAWVSVPQNFDDKDILLDLFRQLRKAKEKQSLSLEQLKEGIRNYLTWKRYLIVLDDVRTSGIFKTLNLDFQNTSSSSKVILTTRDTFLARHINTPTTAIPQCLLKDIENLELLMKKDICKTLNLDCQNSSSSSKEDIWKTLNLDCQNSSSSSKVKVILPTPDTSLARQDNTLTMAIQQRLLKDIKSCALLKKDNWKTLINLDCQNSSSSSMVILTSRGTFLARHISTRTTVIQQRLLKDKESWELFMKKVVTSKTMKIDAEDQELLKFREKILRRCRGLPQQIVLLGGLLSTKNSYDEWPTVIEQSSQKTEKKKEIQDEDQLKSSGLLVSSTNTKQNNTDNKLDSKQKGEKIAVDNQSNSLADQLVTKQKEEHGKQEVTEQATSSSGETQSNSLLEQPPSDIKRTEEKGKVVVVDEDAMAGEDQEIPSSHLASSSNYKGDVTSNSGMEASAADNQSTSSETTPSGDYLYDSYQQLSIHEKCCLLYLGLFPEKYEISIRRLLLLWIAEGLVIPSDGKTPFEEAMHYFERLETLEMIKITDGSPKKCSVPNAVREKLHATAQKVGFFHFHSKNKDDNASLGQRQDDKFTVRRLAESEEMYIRTNPHDNCLRHLRTYISFYQKKGDAPTSGVNNLLKKIVDRGSAMLVVLDLEGVYKPVLPDKLGNLIFLKYLSLRGTLLDSIPESVGNLPNLETLDIKHTYIITLPSTIWKAKKLQHLYMSEIYVDLSIEKELACGVSNLKTCVPMGESSGTGSDALKDLQTLWGLVIRGSIDEENWLSQVVGLRKVKLTFHKESSEVLSGWLSKQTNLQSLKLRCISKSNKPASLHLGPLMTASSNLKQMYLVGKLPKPIEFGELPQGLEILTLSVSCLNVDPMEMLGKLQKLKVLKLYANSFRGETLRCRHNGFPALRILKLWMLPKLKNWIVEKNAMPELKEVEIRYCEKLETVEGLNELTKLTDLILTNMTDEVFNNVKGKVDPKVLITQNSLTFNPLWKDDQEDTQGLQQPF